MKEKTKELIEKLRRILLQRDGLNYSDDTLIRIAIENEIKKIPKEDSVWKGLFFLELAIIIVLTFVLSLFVYDKPQGVNLENLEKQGDCYMNWEAICNSFAKCPGLISYTYLEIQNITLDDFLASHNDGCESDFIAIENKELFGYEICYKKCYI